MTQLTAYEPIKCAASNVRMDPDWDRYGIDVRRGFEGDVVLVETLADSGAYAEIEDASGRSASLYRGDRFVAVLGNRESSKYLCGAVPEEGIDLAETPVLQLLTNGGIVGLAAPSPEYLKPPLEVRCHGVLTLDGETVNTIARVREDERSALRPIVLVGASATDAGKTTLASRLVASLSRDQGLAVAAAKLAGTGCLEDVLEHREAGARWIADFPDVGLPSTYTAASNYEPAVRSLLHLLSGKEPDIIVAELGGDLIWANIPTLFGMADVMESVVALVVIPGDVLGAIGTAKMLGEWGVTPPVVWGIPPTRNPTGFRLRMRAYVEGELIDTRSREDVERLAARLAASIG